MIDETFATKRDEETFLALAEAIHRGSVVAFVGAGMSARAGFRDWEGLLEKMWSLLGGEARQHRSSRTATGLDLDDLSWRAEEIRALVPEEKYRHLLKRHFRGAGKRDGAIDAFARIKFRHIFTTNYDLSIESALSRSKRKPTCINWLVPDKPSEVMQSFGETNPARPYLVYLHGCTDDPATIVLSEQDYRRQYVRSDETVRKLFAIFSMRQVAFFGFSLRDPDVLSIFRQVKASNEKASHYAVLPVPALGGKEIGPEDMESSRLRLANKFGIHPIFFRGGGPDFPNLVPLIKKLVEASSRAAAPRRRAPRGSTYAGASWTSTTAFRTLRAKANPDDPQKGRFGGSARCNGRELSAVVERDSGAKSWFNVEITVASISRRPLQGRVDLWVHDSFPQEHYWTQVRKGRAKFSFSVYGAFTVGAVADRGKTPLELDLADVKDAPSEFRIA